MLFRYRDRRTEREDQAEGGLCVGDGEEGAAGVDGREVEGEEWRFSRGAVGAGDAKRQIADKAVSLVAGEQVGGGSSGGCGQRVGLEEEVEQRRNDGHLGG